MQKAALCYLLWPFDCEHGLQLGCFGFFLFRKKGICCSVPCSWLGAGKDACFGKQRHSQVGSFSWRAGRKRLVVKFESFLRRTERYGVK